MEGIPCALLLYLGKTGIPIIGTGLGPICPFITEALWTRVYSITSIHLESFPAPIEGITLLNSETTATLMSLNSAIWTLKKQSGQSLRSKLEEIQLPTSLLIFAEDLQAMHNVKKVSTSDFSEEKWVECLRTRPSILLKLSTEIPN